MASDFDIVLKREARTSLQEFKNQSLLRRRFGEDAVKLCSNLKAQGGDCVVQAN